MDFLIDEIESRLHSIEEELRYAELNDTAHTEGYKLALKERRILKRTLKKLNKLNFQKFFLN